MAGPLVLRMLAAEDLPVFFAYLNDHLRDNGTGGMDLFMPMARGASSFPGEKEAGFRAGMAKPVGQPGWRRAWGATDGAGRIAGHIDLRSRPEPLAAHRVLLGMGVHRDFRRQGLGLELIEAAGAWALEQQAIDWIDLEVLSQNMAARRLYVRAGFTEVGAIPDMFRIDGESHGYNLMSRRIR